jgi:hypothetical protein
MTTTAFQYVFNNAETIAYNRRAVTAQTISRDNTVRTVSRGGQAWRFDVKLPDGIRWSEVRGYIEAIDYADRYTDGNVQINNAGYNTWLTPYQGNSINFTGFAATWTQGANTITLTTSPTTSSGFKFKAGDLIQLGSSGKVYSVVTDVAYNSNTVTLNRAIIDNTAVSPVSLIVGTNVTWNVICVELPSWTIFARDQVSWSGPFVFYENLV